MAMTSTVANADAKRTTQKDAELSADQIEAAYKKAREQQRQNVQPVRVLVAGNTGVGKSSLINAVFGKDVFPTGTGKPVTEGIDEQEAENLPLRVLDTRGFETSDATAFKKVDQELARRRGLPDPADHIHVAWLCVAANSARLEPKHEEFIKLLAKHELPCIIVLTKADQGQELLHYVQGWIAEHISSFPSHKIEALEVLATPTRTRGGHETAAHGVKELVEHTYRFLPAGAQTAFAQAQRASLSLKRVEAKKTVALAAAAAVATAPIPVPGGHNAALVLIQVGMMARIDSIYENALVGGTAAIKGIVTKLASSGGRWAFGLALENALKFLPGIGSAVGSVVGAAVGGSITTAMGFAYIEVAERVAGGEPGLSTSAAIFDEIMKEFGKARKAAA